MSLSEQLSVLEPPGVGDVAALEKFLRAMLLVDPAERGTVLDALQHDWLAA